MIGPEKVSNDIPKILILVIFISDKGYVNQILQKPENEICQAESGKKIYAKGNAVFVLFYI